MPNIPSDVSRSSEMGTIPYQFEPIPADVGLVLEGLTDSLPTSLDTAGVRKIINLTQSFGYRPEILERDIANVGPYAQAFVTQYLQTNTPGVGFRSLTKDDAINPNALDTMRNGTVLINPLGTGAHIELDGVLIGSNNHLICIEIKTGKNFSLAQALGKEKLQASYEYLRQVVNPNALVSYALIVPYGYRLHGSNIQRLQTKGGEVYFLPEAFSSLATELSRKT